MASSRSRAKSKKSQAAKAKQLPRKTADASVNPRQLLNNATAKLEQGDPASAATIAGKAYEHIGDSGRHSGALFVLLGQIHVELGELDAARGFFLKAVEADPDGGLDEELGGGAEKFLWLAQLSEDGGPDSAAWYEKGVAVLRQQIAALTAELEGRPLPHSRDAQQAAGDDKKKKLAQTLCSVAELYMTDLSWEADAEQRCERLVTEATMVAPDLADAWQTVANVRISQTRTDDAKTALRRSMELWTELDPEDPNVPAFPTRVSLVRLLIEVGMEEEAIDVADRLVVEDDQSVEVWYLGGFASYNLGERLKAEDKSEAGDVWKAAWRSSRKWLTKCLALFQLEEYEDDRLGEHAKELLEAINKEIPPTEGDEDDDEEGWVEMDGDGDEEMT